jgi:SNF2 family DNA or RNA helicase
LDLDAEHRDIYGQIEADVISYLSGLAAKDEKFLESIKKLPKEEREFAINERRASVELRTARAKALVQIEKCKQAAAIGKLEQAVEWIEDFLENDEKLVVFCTHRIIVNELLARFPKALTIVGGQSTESRDTAIQAFQNNPKKRLMVCTIKAGGVGTTLTASSNTVFLELAWGPGDHDQAEDRCHRIGQKDAVNAWYLLARDTIEEKIAQLIESKRLVVNAVTDGDPLHNASQGTILGDLVQQLTGKISLLN